jgi:LacI family transcriptional regulator
MPKDRRPTAFFCAGDSSALLLQRALILRGVRFPEDISVISFGGGTYLTRYAVIPLTAVWQPFEEMGAAAMRLALGQEKPGSPLILPTKLITGESDGPYENKK